MFFHYMICGFKVQGKEELRRETRNNKELIVGSWSGRREPHYGRVIYM